MQFSVGIKSAILTKNHNIDPRYMNTTDDVNREYQNPLEGFNETDLRLEKKIGCVTFGPSKAFLASIPRGKP
jgi:hypothetical protein